MYGVSVTLYVYSDLKQDAFGQTADIWLMRWDDGLLVQNDRILRGVAVA
jgi:hypothetical protein